MENPLYGDFRTMLLSLSDDVVKASQIKVEKLGDAYAERAFVRAVFAMIEGTVFQLKQVILQHTKINGITLTSGQISLLLEESYEIKTTGAINTRSKFLRLHDNLKFTLKLYSEVVDTNFKYDPKDEGWKTLKRAIEIRNRITHPKSITDLHISYDDSEIIDQCGQWFRRMTIDLFVANAKSVLL